MDFLDTLIETAPVRTERMRRAMENIGLNTPEDVNAALKRMEREAQNE